MRVNIKYVSLISAFKMGCAVSGILTLLLIGPYFLCSAAGMASLISLLPPQLALSLGCLSSTAVIGAFVFVGSLIAGSLSWIFSALIYNVAAIITGGLNVKLARHEQTQKKYEEPADEDEDPMVQSARKNLDRAEAFAREKKKRE